MDNINTDQVGRELSAHAARLIHNANEDLGPLGPYNEVRMAQVIYYEVVAPLLKHLEKPKRIRKARKKPEVKGIRHGEGILGED